MEESKKYITVALNGDGGDENFAGYYRYLLMKMLSLIKLFPFKKALIGLARIFYRRLGMYRNMAALSRFETSLLTFPPPLRFYQELISFTAKNSKILSLPLIRSGI